MANLFRSGTVGLLRQQFPSFTFQTRNAWKTRRRLSLPEKYWRPTWVNPYIVGDYIKDINPQPEYPESYDLYDHEYTHKPDFDRIPIKVKVLLLDNVDGIGGKGDIVTVRAEKKNELLLSQRAVYASEFNLKYYEDLIKNKVSFDRPSSLLVPFTSINLKQSVFPIFMSDSNPWTLTKQHIMTAFRHGGLVFPESAVEEPPPGITGPDMKKQFKVLVVHVTINNKETVPTKVMIVHLKTQLKEQFTAGKLQPLLESQRELLDSLPIIEKTVADVDEEDEFA